jgi:predicted nuclease of predicted toxin-antitoxin system
MNLSPRWTGIFESAGYSVTHWLDCGDPGALDSEILYFAKEHGFVLLTHDLDFGAMLAATSGTSPSVIQIRARNLNPDLIANEVIAAIDQVTNEIQAGALLIIQPGSVRVRVLPLQFKPGT